MKNISNRKGKALITGPSSGIGAVYADRLAKRGYDLILVARNLGKLEELAERLTSETGRHMQVIRADLSNKDDLLKVEDVIKTDNNLSMLVNNAGYSKSTPFIDSTSDELEQMIALNIIALTRLSNAAAKNFITKKSGTIINIGSGVVMMPDQYNEVYGGSKAYVLNFTRNIAAQLSVHGIQVQAVLPGAVLTEAFERSGTDISAFPEGTFMTAEDLVDASMAGLDQKEIITFASLQDLSDWNKMEEARIALIPQLFKSKPASRYLL